MKANAWLSETKAIVTISKAAAFCSSLITHLISLFLKIAND